MFQGPDLTLAVIEVPIESSLSANRAFVFSNQETFDISKAMVLGVWDSHTRLLLPSAETLPYRWESWCDAIGTVVYRRWVGWQADSVTDSARASCNLAPCRICARNVRIPVTDYHRCAGMGEPWWSRRNPCSHTTNPTKKAREATWAPIAALPTYTHSYVGRGILTDEASRILGCKYLPDCDHTWRTDGPSTVEAASYGVDLNETPPDISCAF